MKTKTDCLLLIIIGVILSNNYLSTDEIWANVMFISIGGFIIGWNIADYFKIKK